MISSMAPWPSSSSSSSSYAICHMGKQRHNYHIYPMIMIAEKNQTKQNNQPLKSNPSSVITHQ
ncbi:hypothetical protein DERF_011682 [Dermatophagoides farinae]|uniref:Uncharacterized protein n=1 Tax=Dermatophagoides farinae TaxID=6954 RepID=A0A922L1V8_DERFA|nr:hypothetical protein DERF_011682 [Dermatophagoides farinae]